MRSGSASVERHPWVRILIQGWRLEITLCTVTFAVLAFATILAPIGPVVVIGIVIAALQVRPEIGHRLKSAFRENRYQRWLHAGLWDCAIIGRNGDIPRIMKSVSLPVGRRFLLALPVGLHYDAVQKRLPELAAALGVRDIRLKPIAESARFLELAVIWRDAFPKVTPSSLLNQATVSLWDPLHLGVGQDGLPIAMGLAEHNLLIGGEPGSGKSVALSTIVAAAALDPSVQLTLLDGKHVELAAWSEIAERFVGSSQDEAVSALENLRQIMDFRYASLVASRRRKIAPTDVEGLHVVVIDELAFYLRGGKKETREHFADLLRDLVSRGRAAGIVIIAATQKPSHEIVPTYIRDLFAYRLAMRCTSPDASDTILGQGWATQGFSAATIDPTLRGVGYLLAEGGVPTLIMTPYLSDDDIDVLALRAFNMRLTS